ncbi:MAG: hypothetical protein HY820_23180 [Acidobacteria bacterium]|nr:hypothetical protein [Acidobacteriota bacterium]
MRRREFAFTTAAACAAAELPLTKLPQPELTAGARRIDGPPLLPGGVWYSASKEGEGLVFRIPPGSLAKARYLTTELLLDGDTLSSFSVNLQEGDKGPVFRFGFGALNQCSLRMRMSLALVDQNKWMVEREGAFLKPTCGGDRVDLDKVDRIRFVIRRKGPEDVRWTMTPLLATVDEVPKLEKPILPKGALLDELGQSAHRAWSGKTQSADELKTRIRTQLAEVPKACWPDEFSAWGGDAGKRIHKGTGYFGTHHDGTRWWLVDPQGFAFWSAGVDCVRVDCVARVDGIEPALAWMPPADGEYVDALGGGNRQGGKSVSYLAANMIRALGRDGWKERWARIALAEMRRMRFNTVGNWSDYEYAAAERFPYVRPLSFRGERSPFIYRDFPDVFHPGFEQDAAAYASQLQSTVKDPALIGYFLMNEPTWGFSSEVPAAGMLFTSDTCYSRKELARKLKAKYATDAALSTAWKREATFAQLESGKWKGALSQPAIADLREFSVSMVQRYFTVLSQACKRADPNHLNLGMRWAGVPPEWAVEGMKTFDVFSLNCYMDRLPRERAQRIERMVGKPVLVGEWHFGALDVGLPASGIGRLRNQAERAKAYRAYLEDAAANPYCVGVHWFTLYDQSALGRFDGENYNIGFLDICNRVYPEMAAAAIASHERMYEVAGGKAAPFSAELEYLPKVFL